VEQALNNRTQLVIIAILCLLAGTASGYGLSYTIYQPKIERHEKQVSDLTLEIAELNSTVSSQTHEKSCSATQTNPQSVSALMELESATVLR